MAKKICALLAVFMLAGALIMIAQTTNAPDARAVLLAVTAALGSDNVKSVQYTGMGQPQFIRVIGQSYKPEDDWPNLDMPSYTRTIDYVAKTSSEQFTQSQGRNPGRGGGGIPLQADRQQFNLVSGDYAWSMQGNTPTPQPAAAEQRQLEIWLTPHGFLKAASQAKDLKATRLTLADTTASPGGNAVFLSFTYGKFRINGQINDKNEVERVQTWVPNAVLGDMFWEARYTNYKDFGGGVKFPGKLHYHSGMDRGSAAHNWMEVNPADVKINPTISPLVVPDAVKNAPAPTIQVASERLANGVWRIGGGSHHSLAVEFKDFVTVVEAPLNEARSLAVIAEVKKLLPSKPIKYVVNTHFHYDHSGGLRTYAVVGATIVTNEANRAFYERYLLDSHLRTLEPDLLSNLNPWFAQNRVPTIEAVKDEYKLSDETRTMNLYLVPDVNHAAGMLVAYLPAEKLLINADLYSPPAAGAQPPAATRDMAILLQNIQRLKLDVAQHVGLHGAVGANADFVKLAATAPPAPPEQPAGARGGGARGAPPAAGGRGGQP